jgi:antitoxin ParD1/3/4
LGPCWFVGANVSLGEHFSDFIAAQMESGRYETASDVVRAGLRLLEEHEAELAELRAALEKGEASGYLRPFDIEEFIARKRREHKKAKKKTARK